MAEFKSGILRGDIGVSTLDLANLRPAEAGAASMQLTAAEHEVLLFLGEQVRGGGVPGGTL